MLRNLVLRRSTSLTRHPRPTYQLVFRITNPFHPRNLSSRTFSIMSQQLSEQPPAKIQKIANETLNKDDPNFKPIVWIDCEMTGLDVFNDHIIEICCIITDGNLNIIDEEGYESVVHYDNSVMDKMNEWCIEHHGGSGLTQKVLESNKTLIQVEDELYQYVSKYTNQRSAVLAGNSVHMDRAFMMREMPKVLEHLHYRLIDVSTITEIGNRHNMDLISKLPKKKEAHTARSDILESIAQLKWYQDHYLVQPEHK